ncbi:DUF4212 domain-containing protein [Roseateles amylovorans]|uniref:DUF4212 domain-containing protein n=1 Tax=Roseateles amylovorans TaxID=2978473 RepID=A0ABY6B6L6_9BURK|nr:DUF4212 domain-containing protein [Roseateles amylovorans]UXH80815.1 DUF4212 domain-containing protein [Roseateles amylovorans]
MSPTGAPQRPRVWPLTLSLLALWASVTFGVAWFARDLSFDFFGWPFSFWVGAQGGLIVYCLIVWYYARTMNRREAAWVAVHGAAPPPVAPPAEPVRSRPSEF